MSVRSGSVSPSSPIAGSPVSTAAPFSLMSPLAGSNAETILFESYLQKTPPLKSFIMKWTKRWFVLSKIDPMDPTSIQLSYYKDDTKREGKRTIDLSRFVGIRPRAKVGNHEHVFAIETEERKYILKAQDLQTKNIWLAKLCELFGQEQVCHVTIPQQPSSAYTEAILKLSNPSRAIAVAPSTGSVILEIPFDEIRRIGAMDAYGTDIIWFETCKHSVADKFYFFSVPSGREVAHSVVRELKTAIECYTSVLLIMEDSNEQEISFISRDHYGCPQFPSISRNAIMQTGLRQLPACWQTFIMQERMRRESESHSTQTRSNSLDQGSSGGMSLDEWSAAKGRRKTSSMKGPPSITRRPTLDKFVRQASITSCDRDQSSPLPELLSSGHFSDSNEVFDPPHPSPPSPPSLHNSPRTRKPSLSHQSSTSSLTTSTPSPPIHRQRKLSYQSSVSSHSSTNSFPAQPIVVERVSPHTSISSLDFEDSTHEQTFSYIASDGPSAPAIPPRSVVSLQEEYVYSRHLATAH